MNNSRIRIFIIGQCTLHWGRMEYGNIGNYYIIEPFFEQLRRVFPDAEIATTMQFSESFCQKYCIETAPMELYYDFNREDNLVIAQEELLAVELGKDIESDYIKEVKRASLVIDFSGDIWGDNADFLGRDRFATGCYKDLIAQKLRPTVMLAGSPGPFKSEENVALAKKTYAGFTLVTNREHISTRLLKEQGFDLSKTFDYPCPSFIFNKAEKNLVEKEVKMNVFECEEKIKIGFMLCGWNFEKGPFDLWPREDDEYSKFIELIKDILDNNSVHLFLLSHSNGFEVPPKTFELKHGRDFPIMEQLYNILVKEGYANRITLLDGIYLPNITKGIISEFDVLISGRMHGAVAGISQAIPTMIIDYGHEPKAHKLRGFSDIAGTSEYIADPNKCEEMKKIANKCISYRSTINEELSMRMENVKKMAKEQFDLLKDYA